MAYAPVFIGEHFRIVPPGTPPHSERLDLVMQRGAFGSGEHETTASCLEWLAELPAVVDANLLDLGSGTGILALAALRLGAASAVCVDTSAQAVATCRHNCALNGFGERVIQVNGSLADLELTGFDLAFANIYGDLLRQFAADLARRVRPGGWLILSGILWEDNYAVRQAYQEVGCRIERNRMLADYSSLLLQKI